MRSRYVGTSRLGEKRVGIGSTVATAAFSHLLADISPRHQSPRTQSSPSRSRHCSRTCPDSEGRPRGDFQCSRSEPEGSRAVSAQRCPLSVSHHPPPDTSNECSRAGTDQACSILGASTGCWALPPVVRRPGCLSPKRLSTGSSRSEAKGSEGILKNPVSISCQSTSRTQPVRQFGPMPPATQSELCCWLRCRRRVRRDCDVPH